MWLFDGISALLLKMHHALASLLYTTVLSRHRKPDMEHLREHVDIWDKDYGVILNEGLCCAFLSLLTLLSDSGLCCCTEAGAMSVLYFYTLATHSRVNVSQGWDLCGLSWKFKISCQSTEATSLPRLRCALTLVLVAPLLN